MDTLDKYERKLYRHQRIADYLFDPICIIPIAILYAALLLLMS